MSSQSYVCKAIIEAPRSAERRHGLREIVVGESLDSVADIERLWDLVEQGKGHLRRPEPPSATADGA